MGDRARRPRRDSAEGATLRRSQSTQEALADALANALGRSYRVWRLGFRRSFRRDTFGERGDLSYAHGLTIAKGATTTQHVPLQPGRAAQLKFENKGRRGHGTSARSNAVTEIKTAIVKKSRTLSCSPES
jgi:hypothetical protein